MTDAGQQPVSEGRHLYAGQRVVRERRGRQQEGGKADDSIQDCILNERGRGHRDGKALNRDA